MYIKLEFHVQVASADCVVPEGTDGLPHLPTAFPGLLVQTKSCSG